MGSLEHIDSGMTVAPKAVLPHTLLVHLLRHLISVFGHWERRKKYFATGVSFLGMGKKASVGLKGSHRCRLWRALGVCGCPAAQH